MSTGSSCTTTSNALSRQARRLLTALIEERLELGEDAYVIIHRLERAGIEPVTAWSWLMQANRMQ